jgi:hypothetical protein
MDFEIDVDLNGYVFDMSDESDRQLLEWVLSQMLEESKQEGEAA